MGLFNNFGSILLFIACILLIVSTISTPVVNNLSLATVQTGSRVYRFGVLGWCNTAGFDKCSPKALGYRFQDALGEVSNWDVVNNSINGLTKALILHPIAAALSFIGFLIALVSHKFGNILAAFFAFLAFVCSLVAMAIDFAIFGVVKGHINKNNLGHAKYGAATWVTVVATILLLFSIIFVLIQCCCCHRDKAPVRAEGIHNDSHELNEKKSGPFWKRNRA
ncbi:hypothetical protein Q8F55_001639 [Vanrija albida]|uniref:Pali-domain-containing protein n=1 Tax=Vanrija albida TaxID=181172 RepID=A0ABR3Q7S3_9TREE